MKASSDDFNISLLIPTLNAGALWHKVLESVSIQTCVIIQKMIVDSGSTDNTVKLALEHGFEVIHITKEQFNHGATRQLLVDKADKSTICVFLTQDAILASNKSIENLVNALSDPHVNLAYGRQLPHDRAKPLEVHARMFNYPENSAVRTFGDKDKLGFKAFFCSNSFAAYRRDTLIKIGGFPSDSIMGEDAIVAARLLIAGHKVAYVAQATVKHSHSYTLKEEFKRYFDTRVFHEQNSWLIDHFGRPDGEGIKYVKSELKFTLAKYPTEIFKSIISIFSKWLGYSLAKHYQKMPLSTLKTFSMHRSYWR